MNESKLAVTVASMELKNPLILGSSDLTVTEGGMERFANAGFGAIVTKTTTLEPIAGNPKPWLTFEKDRYLLVSGGLPNPGYKVMAQRIAAVKDKVHEQGCKMICSCAGTTPEEIVEMAKTLEKAGADAIQINMFCPHLGPLVGRDVPIGMYWAENPEGAAKVTRAVKSEISIPLFIKYRGEQIMASPELALAIEKAGADVEVATPQPDGMLINIDDARGIIGNPERCGSAFGPTNKPVGIKCIADLVRVLRIPVIGGGGVLRGTDAIEYLMVGAPAVELCTAMYWYGHGSVAGFLKEMEDFVGSSPYYNCIKDLIGAALSDLPDLPYRYKKLGFTARK